MHARMTSPVGSLARALCGRPRSLTDTHDAQCVIYHGPDTQHTGKELCFCSNEEAITVVDMSDKANPVQISRTSYNHHEYTHQSWLTEDHAYMLLNDELDERGGLNGGRTRTLIFDMRDLAAPVHFADHLGADTAIDHNLYIRGQYGFLSNYCAGLRILDVSQIAAGITPEVGFFDVAPDCDSVSFAGTWSNYPYLSTLSSFCLK